MFAVLKTSAKKQLQKKIQKILQEWERRLRLERPVELESESRKDLRNNIPRLLEFIVEALSRRLDDIGEGELRELARNHAIERSLLPNYSLANVVRELNCLREVLMLQLIGEYYSVSAHDILLINKSIDIFIESSVVKFVENSQIMVQEFGEARTQLLTQMNHRRRQFEAILEQMPVGIVIAERPDGKLLFSNEEAARLLRHPLSPTHVLSGEGAFHENGRPYAGNEYPIFRAVFNGEIVRNQEILYRLDDNDTACFNVSAAPVTVNGNGESVAVSVFSDVSALKKIQTSLAQEKARVAGILHAIGDGVVTIYHERIHDMNAAAERLLGWRADEARERPAAEVIQFFDERDQVPIPCPIKHCLKENRIIELTTFMLLKRKDGVFVPTSSSLAPLLDDRGQVEGAVIVLQEATQARRIFQEVSLEASSDPLTGLVNRREFERRLSRTIASIHQNGSPAALLYLDLDKFKEVNDCCGHDAGDRFLREIVSVIQAQVRERDTVARLGGDEFACILEHCSVDQALSIANDIRNSVHAYDFKCGDYVFVAGVSVGVAGIHDGAQDVSQILKQADQACYAAKQAGRNQVCLASDVDGGGG